MKSFKVRDYSVDSNLGYLIQQITKDPTHEVLAYFYGVSQFVMAELLRKSKASWINKDVILFYKDTPITYRINLSGAGPGREKPNISIKVTFPRNDESHKVDEIMTAVMESGLTLTGEHTMDAFPTPQLKTPKCLTKVRIAQDEQRAKTGN